DDREGRAMSDSNSNFRLDGRKAVVTGGGRGIGYAIARRAAMFGASVALLDLEQEALERAATQLREEVEGAAAREALEAGWGRADVLVNNAGIFSNAPAAELTVEEWDRVLRVNLSGAFYCS